MTFVRRTIEEVQARVLHNVEEWHRFIEETISDMEDSNYVQARLGRAAAFVLGDDHEIHGLFCPSCASEKTAFDSTLYYIEPVTLGDVGARRCDGCNRFPLALRAGELLRPSTLAFLAGRVYEIARRAAARFGGGR